MERTDVIDNFKRFVQANRESIMKHTVRVEDLPADDEWISDDAWDEIYKQEVSANGDGHI